MEKFRVIKELLPDDCVLGVSGGVDSVSCAYFLLRNGYNFSCIHFNGNLIEQDKEAEEKVIRFCSNFKIPLYLCYTDKKYNNTSKEDFARKTRLESIGNKMNAIKKYSFITAHNLSECAESYLWCCLRGKASFMPIPEKTVFSNFILSRPFLLTPKSSFVEYARKNSLNEFIVEDELNLDMKLNRPWIRHSLLPQINARNYNLETVTKKIIVDKLKKRGYSLK